MSVLFMLCMSDVGLCGVPQHARNEETNGANGEWSWAMTNGLREGGNGKGYGMGILLLTGVVPHTVQGVHAPLLTKHEQFAAFTFASST